ncbi:MAG: holo-ACP synthase [Ardenticatenia bacterium]|nr:holo-ACP synthase [Ardenticatenia bacterium]
MVIAVGVDIVEVARIRAVLARHGQRFLDRIFTPAEQVHCGRRVPCLAARWAAKEAVSKALGCGIGDVAWKEIEILPDKRRMPVLQLGGRAARLAAEQGIRGWAVSLSHAQEYAVAFVVAWR